MLKPKVPVERMVFNEITKEAITGALANTRQIDMDLVDAQETRRIVDRLVGWGVSPVLWSKFGSMLSAGRVQSVAVRLLVQRDQAIAELQLGEQAKFFPSDAALASWMAQADKGLAQVVYE